MRRCAPSSVGEDEAPDAFFFELVADCASSSDGPSSSAEGSPVTVPHMTYALLNRVTAKPGERHRLVEILLESGKLFDDDPACQLYLVGEANDDPNVVWVVDVWTTQEAHEKALKAPAMRPFVERAMPLLEGMPEQIEIRPRGGKGLQA